MEKEIQRYSVLSIVFTSIMLLLFSMFTDLSVKISVICCQMFTMSLCHFYQITNSIMTKFKLTSRSEVIVVIYVHGRPKRTMYCSLCTNTLPIHITLKENIPHIAFLHWEQNRLTELMNLFIIAIKIKITYHCFMFCCCCCSWFGMCKITWA